MTYIDYLNQFWKIRRTKKISSIEADLYFCLLQECNARGWENPFEYSNGLICATIGVSEKTMIDARNRLQQKGLIGFEPGLKKQRSPIYELLNCNNSSINVSIKVSKKVSINHSINVNSLKDKDKEEDSSSTDVEENICESRVNISGIEKNAREEKKTWRNDFQMYLNDLRNTYNSLIRDPKFITTQQRLNPGIDIKLTLEKACVNFWATEAGWKNKKQKRSGEIDWKSTLTNAISQSQNRVYESRNNSISDRNARKRDSLDKLESEAFKQLFGNEGQDDQRCHGIVQQAGKHDR